MIQRIFSWWNGHTIGAAFDIKRRSKFVGEDEFGNRYYEDKKKSVGGRHRRYVMYDGLAEPSKVPPEWHGWLHHTFEDPPTETPLLRRDWETDHRPNLTGTDYAYKPDGSMATPEERQASPGDYDAWTPDA